MESKTKIDLLRGCSSVLISLQYRRYRTLADRLLGIRLVYAQRTVHRNVSFEYLNRQLVWHAFTVSHLLGLIL